MNAELELKHESLAEHLRQDDPEQTEDRADRVAEVHLFVFADLELEHEALDEPQPPLQPASLAR